MPGVGKAAGAFRAPIPDHPTVHIRLTHLPAHGAEVGLVFGPDLFGEGVAGVVGGCGNVAVEVEQWGERFANYGVAIKEEEGAVDQAAELGFNVAVAVGGRAAGCGEAAHGVGFVEELAAAGLQGLVGLLVAGDGDVDAGVGEPQGGELHARHCLVEIVFLGAPHW